MQFLVLILLVHICACENIQKSQLRRRLTGNYDINQYANDAGGDVMGGVGEVEDGNLDDSNAIEGGGGGGSGESVASLFETIPGQPKRDYPTYRSIPKTGFTCKGRVNWGYYADVETECQVFHVCESEFSKISFLCPLGSAFNQKHLVCDWWYNFDCHEEISLTSLYDFEAERISASEQHDQHDQHDQHHHDNRDNRSTLQSHSKYSLDVEDDYANDDLNLVSSGGNI